MKNKPTISIIVICKERLHHLKQTIPSYIRQKNSEIIVLDWNCNDGTVEWLKNNYPEVVTIKINEPELFRLSRARNIAANYAKSEILLFIDCDVFINCDFTDWIDKNFLENFHYIASLPSDSNLRGTVIVSKNNFEKCGGYDEAYIGWGGEDRELYMRLEHYGFLQKYFNHNFLKAIPHGDEERLISLEKGGMGSRFKALIVSRAYINIKKDLLKLGVEELGILKRIELMDLIKKAAFEIDSYKSAYIHIFYSILSDEDDFNITRKITYQINNELGLNSKVSKKIEYIFRLDEK